jgi:4'-phosphopantetheinyl transferase
MTSIAASQRLQLGIVEDDWTPGPVRPWLGNGVVHVWRAELSNLADGAERSPALAASLSPEERTRATRIVNPRRRDLWIAAHAVLRALLGRYLDADPSVPRLASGAHGKPELLDDAAGSGAALAHPMLGSVSRRPTQLSFNLSHSGEQALYAFARGGSVGVDLEVARRPVDQVAIAHRVLGVEEARRLRGLPRDCREREFLRAWTCHEARLKCRGTGFGRVAAADRGGRGSTWVAELEIGPRAGGAVAGERCPQSVRLWTL